MSYTPNRVGPGMVRRTYYLPDEVVRSLDRAIVEAQADAYVDRAPNKSAVIAAIIRRGIEALPSVIVDLRTVAISGNHDAPSTRSGPWNRPVAVPQDLDELKGPVTGVVRLPLSIHASGAGPTEEFDVSRPSDRASMYQVLLREGSIDDLRHFVNGRALRRIWPRLWLPKYVRDEWARHFPEMAA